MRTILILINLILLHPYIYSQQKFLSSSEGQITKIYINHDFKVDKNELFIAFIDSLSKDNRKLIVYYNSDRKDGQESLDKDDYFIKKNCTYINLKNAKTGDFVQDECIVSTDKRLTIIHPITGKNKQLEKSFACFKSDFIVDSNSVNIPAGNVLFMDSLCFVGKDELMKNDSLDIIKALNKNIIWIGTKMLYTNQINRAKTYQPEFHIDLFMNVVYLHKKDSILFLFGRSKYDSEIGHFESEKNFNNQIDKTIEQLKEQLKELNISNYIIDSLPIVIRYDNIRMSYSYNNSFIESNAKQTKMYLPFYKDIDYTESIKKTLEKYDIKTVFIGNKDLSFDQFSARRGSLHCIVKVLDRK